MLNNQINFVTTNKLIATLQELQLVRLAANKLRLNSLPLWFWNLPKLSWVAIAGNINDSDDNVAQPTYNTIEWTDLDIMEKLGEGASGIIYRAKWRSNNISNANLICEALDDDDKNFVAVKLFKGGRTSDGLPEDEMKAAEAAGKHTSSFEVFGRIVNAPNDQLGLVMPLIPSNYKILGGPPSFATVTRDTFDIDKRFELQIVLKILTGISSVCDHLHKRGISHGDLYAHNILVNREGSCLLSDFGASSFYHKVHIDDVGSSKYGHDSVVELISSAMEGFEVRAFGCLVEDLLDRISSECATFPDNDVYENILKSLRSLLQQCTALQLSLRPTFQSISTRLAEITSTFENSII